MQSLTFLPAKAALWRGVSPMLSCIFASAPVCKWDQQKWLHCLQTCLKHRAITTNLTLSNSSTISLCPKQEARWIGVHPALALDLAAERIMIKSGLPFLVHMRGAFSFFKSRLTSAVDVEGHGLVNPRVKKPLNVRTTALFGIKEKLVLRCVRLHPRLALEGWQ